MRIIASYIIGAVLMSLAFGCGSDAPAVGIDGVVVGGPCSIHQHCSASGMCLVGGDFPDGTCSVPCDTDGECPQGTACISKDDGICLLECIAHQDCRPGYSCSEEDRKGGSGKARVCIHD